MRADAALEAVRRYAAMDPAGWGTGLSAEGARRGLAEAAAAIEAGWEQALAAEHGVPPRSLLIWCASNVFTAPLEWTALFAALGVRVTLKAPQAAPEPVRALVEAFAPLGVRLLDQPHAEALSALPQHDAVMGFGSDEAMRALAASLHPGQRRSLHGHRTSVALVSGPEAADALALDASLFDGQGCMSPVAVFCVGDAEALAHRLFEGLTNSQRQLPRGRQPPALGPRWRERLALARIHGRTWEAADHAVTLTPFDRLRPSLPRLVAVHALARPEDLPRFDARTLSSCATDLPLAELLASRGFCRVCRPGQLQRPPFPRPHDGVDVLRALCTEVSLEC